MRLTVNPDRPNYAVFQYEFEGRSVFVGYSEFSEISHFGKFCKILDIEFQRRLGDDQPFAEPEVITTILWHGTDEAEAHRQAKTWRGLLKPVWNKDFDTTIDSRANPHILHVERKTVFASVSSAASALGITHANAAGMINRPRFVGFRTGAKPRNHLVTTSAPATHDLRYMRETELTAWRAQHGYGSFTKRTHDPETGKRIRNGR